MVPGLKKEINEENEKITTYTVATDFGYILKYIENNDKDKNFMDYADYSQFKELHLLAPVAEPEKPNCYCITIKYQDPKFICIKQDASSEGATVYKDEYRKDTHSVIALSDDLLV